MGQGSPLPPGEGQGEGPTETNYRGGPDSVTHLDRVRDLRRNQTDAERRLWSRLRAAK